jgi:hypothetical protein
MVRVFRGILEPREEIERLTEFSAMVETSSDAREIVEADRNMA